MLLTLSIQYCVPGSRSLSFLNDFIYSQDLNTLIETEDVNSVSQPSGCSELPTPLLVIILGRAILRYSLTKVFFANLRCISPPRFSHLGLFNLQSSCHPVTETKQGSHFDALRERIRPWFSSLLIRQCWEGWDVRCSPEAFYPFRFNHHLNGYI